jgi:hypothetical protein
MPSPIQFGTQRFTAATGSRPEGVPDHAAMIVGPLIQLDTKNLKKWGVTGKATNQIIAGLTGRPIRACMNADAPDAIALIIGNGKPAYEGSGFKRVAAAITNHGDDDMTKEDGDNPKTYTQAELDAKVKEMLAKQKTDDAAELKKAADAEIAKQNEASIAELTKQKAAHDAAIKKLSADEKAASPNSQSRRQLTTQQSRNYLLMRRQRMKQRSQA